MLMVPVHSHRMSCMTTTTTRFARLERCQPDNRFLSVSGCFLYIFFLVVLIVLMVVFTTTINAARLKPSSVASLVKLILFSFMFTQRAPHATNHITFVARGPEELESSNAASTTLSLDHFGIGPSARRWTRTTDARLFRAALYRLSYPCIYIY